MFVKEPTNILGGIYRGCLHLEGGRGSAKIRELRTGEEGGQPNVDVRIEKNDDFYFFIIIWKYFFSNINVIFEYSVLDRIRLDCKVYPPPYTHTHILHILSAYHRSKFNFN